MKQAHTILLVLALALLGGSGCSDDGVDDPVQITIAQIDGKGVSLAEFDTYLRSNLVPVEDSEPGGSGAPLNEADTVKSRLLESFLDEQILLREAARRGLKTSEEEIAFYIESLQEEDNAVVPGYQVKMAGQRLTLSALEEDVAAEQPEITDDEASEYLAQLRADASDERRVRFRSLRFEKMEDARGAHSGIRKGRNTFDEILVTYSFPPEQGVPVEMAWSELSPRLREALEDVRRGTVSEPTELDGGVYLFQVESWSVGPPPETTRALEAARQDLARMRRQEAYAELLKRLKSGSRLKIFTDRLPFRYSGES